MKNQEIAKILYEIANFLEMEKISFKPYAYEKAAMAIEGLEEDVEDIYKRGGIKELEKIPGVGKSIAEKIEEYLKTGKIKYYEDFKKKFPLNLEELTSIEGLGPKKAKVLYQKLGIKNLNDLEKAAKEHKIAPLFGFGKKTEKNILEGISFVKRTKGRFLLAEILPIAEDVFKKLEGLKEVKRISFAGSLRRRKSTIGDIDILIISNNPEKVMDYFVSLPNIVKIWGKGTTKSSVRVKEGFDIDLRVVPLKSYGAALQYFTGNKEHNIVLRKIAIEKGLKLSEYGLFKGKTMIAGKDEEGIYNKLGMCFVPPELRENNNEIEAALNNSLPFLIEQRDIKGDLHCHSNWDGGENSIEEIAEAARKMSYKYIGIADHTKFLRIEKGLDEKKILKQKEEIDKINKKYLKDNFKIFSGCEANILNDGSIDIKNEVLKKLDFVIAGVHSSFKISKSEMTNRIIKAMRNPNVDIISHPTGRLLKKRDEYQIDFEKILKIAKETNTILEINSYPERLDLKDVYIKKAKEMNVKMIINTDSHKIEQLKYMKFGVFEARRGWAEKKDIINCFDNIVKFLKK
ncbi:MAG TPA: DNA polymerase/3'-5' exonuclease PolX [Candidatus Pacearchaeota archaeon]|nr:DNA polymerase/3'-5' exonuclease PolX [Candidatus Pacearchaeota archaeon]HPO68389.1 DNA polymerase/3'-5' exonuclease PolX [Candidatus Pacearchaeota archaeon]